MKHVLYGKCVKCGKTSAAAPDLTPSQSGIPEDEFAARLRKHLSSKSAEREEPIAIEDPEYEDNTETLQEADAE